MSDLVKIANLLNKKYFAKTGSYNENIEFLEDTIDTLEKLALGNTQNINITINGIKAKSLETGLYDYSTLEGKTISIPQQIDVLKEFINSPYHDYMNNKYTKILDEYENSFSKYSKYIEFLKDLKKYYSDLTNVIHNNTYHISSDDDNFYLLDKFGKELGRLNKLDMTVKSFKQRNDLKSFYNYCFQQKRIPQDFRVLGDLIKKDEHVKEVLNSIKLFIEKNRKTLDELCSIMDSIGSYRNFNPKEFYFKNDLMTRMLLNDGRLIFVSDDRQNIFGQAKFTTQDWKNISNKLANKVISRYGEESNKFNIILNEDVEIYIDSNKVSVFKNGEPGNILWVEKEPSSKEDFQDIIKKCKIFK